MTLGSLFDGSGGFPLGAILCGITPVWAAEVEPYPIKVTKTRIPFMKHLGNVSEIDGAKIEPVDIITFGSPCQDLSIAGKRAGIHEGERSNLFFQAIRIVREMREATNGEYPRYIVWENVPGAFSSNRMGTGGGNVPLVMQCFGICSKSSNSMLSDNPHSGFYEAETSRCLDANGGNPTCNQGGIAVVEGNGSRPSHHGDGYKEDDVMYTLNTTEEHAVAYGIERAAFNIGKNARFGFSIEEEMEPTIVSRGPGAVAFADKAATLSAADGPKGPSGQMMKNPEENFVGEPKTLKIRCGKEGGGKGALIQTDKSATLSCNNDQTLFEPTWSTSKNYYHTNDMKELANTLVASDYKDPPIINDEDDVSYIVRRLTPTECARLQGFPDWWCDNIENENPSEEDMEFWRKVFKTYYTINGKKTVKTDKQIVKWLSSDNGDSAKYKMWGNGVALPNVVFVLSGIAALNSLEEEQNEE